MTDRVDMETGEIIRGVASYPDAEFHALTIPTPNELQRYQTDEALIALTEQILVLGKSDLGNVQMITEIQDARAKVKAIDTYIVQTMRDRASKIEARNNLTELVLRQQRQMGIWLKIMPKNKGARGQLIGRGIIGDAKLASPIDTPPTLDDLSITKKQSARWQKESAIPDDVFEDIIATAKENLWELSSYDLEKYVMKRDDQRRTVRRAENTARAQALPEGVYNVIYADPPWPYDLNQRNGAAEHHYDAMTFEAINALLETLQLEIDENAVLFLWATNPLLIEALAVISAWGFTYKTNVVWVKTELAKPGIGTYVRGRHELLLIATRGSFTPLDYHLSPPIGSVLEAPLADHSRKPDEAYTIIERLYPKGHYVELFARRARETWEAWGNEL